MTILSVDQASVKSGYAVGTADLGCVTCGLVNLGSRFNDLGARMLMFERRVVDLFDKHKPGLLVFEAHRAHAGTQAAQMSGAVTAILMKVAASRGVAFAGAEVGQHKKVFTGTARASKELSLAVARKKYPGLFIEDDNVADAISMLHWAFTRV